MSHIEPNFLLISSGLMNPENKKPAGKVLPEYLNSLCTQRLEVLNRSKLGLGKFVHCPIF